MNPIRINYFWTNNKVHLEVVRLLKFKFKFKLKKKSIINLIKYSSWFGNVVKLVCYTEENFRTDSLTIEEKAVSLAKTEPPLRKSSHSFYTIDLSSIALISSTFLWHTNIYKNVMLALHNFNSNLSEIMMFIFVRVYSKYI